MVLAGGSGTKQGDAALGEVGLELLGRVALVGQDRLAAAQQARFGLEEVPATSRSSSLGWAKAMVTGSPVGVHTR